MYVEKSGQVARRGDHARRERQLELLIQRLPGSLRSAARWLRRPSPPWVRIPVGLLLILGGVFSILPLLGLWMLPLGVVLLAKDIKPFRRLTDRALIWIEHHRPHWMGLSRTSRSRSDTFGKKIT